MRTLIILSLLGAMTLMVGCVPIKIKTPLATCPLAQKAPPAVNGAIFQSSAIRPLFEDRHARNVGDELTITLGDGEVTTPSKKASANQKNGSKLNANLPTVKGEDVADKAGNDSFSGQIVVTVIGVLANGKLVVCGDKLVKYANASANFEYVRFSGIVTPELITAKNTIPSTEVADVQIEYRSSDGTQQNQTYFSRLDRFFLPKQLYF